MHVDVWGATVAGSVGLAFAVRAELWSGRGVNIGAGVSPRLTHACSRRGMGWERAFGDRVLGQAVGAV